MGIFLFEYADNPIFEKEEELKARLREVLLECGECGVSEVCIGNQKTCLLRLNDLSIPEESGYIALSYNRYEQDWWEPTYVNFDNEHFEGVRSRAIGSKVGWAQHYRAMLVARVLCECYSNGTYMVYGNVSYSAIIHALAYIGKKYEFELVHRFIKNRCDLNNFDEIADGGELKEGFWGIRDGVFYYKDFMVAKSLSEWKYKMQNDEDLERAVNGEDIKYCKSQYYLGIRMLYHMLEHDLNDINDVDEKLIQNTLQKYCVGKSKEECEEYLKNLPEDIAKYKGFYYKKWKSIDFILENIDMICKCISLIFPYKVELLATEKEKFLQYYSETENLSEDELTIYKKICIQKICYKPYLDEKREKVICEDVERVMNETESFVIGCFCDEKEYLNELYYFTGGISDFSSILTSKIKQLFSSENVINFIKSWKFKERTTQEIFSMLFDSAERIYEKNNIFLNEDFFYKMIEAAKDKELSFRLDLLCFLLNQLDDDDEQFIASWIIEIDSLYKEYVEKIR